jgi:hypothetical protein
VRPRPGLETEYHPRSAGFEADTLDQIGPVDKDDAGALDVMGFDSAVPAVMADFVRT